MANDPKFKYKLPNQFIFANMKCNSSDKVTKKCCKSCSETLNLSAMAEIPSHTNLQ